MPKKVKSQWDFGELFAREEIAPKPQVLSVTELTGRIRRLLEDQVGEVRVAGEVTNLRLQSSGHIYFTLKDPGAQLGCVLFRGETKLDRSLLQDGRKVNLEGELTVYEPRGQYQLRVTGVELEGVGTLQAAFEKLKLKLKNEGLFAAERKRRLPEYTQRIGLVTSPTGAAIRDVFHVIERRNPGLEIILAPCRVQGDGAAAEIASAIRLLNEYGAAQQLDLILVTRGGGSLEDLWAFNEEVVARAIFESRLPVVSAVGHEIDYTISDFVADVRAATPSAAAEIITEGVFASREFVLDAPQRLAHLAGQQLDAKREEAAWLFQRLQRLHPRRRFNDALQRLDDLQSSLGRSIAQGVRQHRISWRHLAERLVRLRPAAVIRLRAEALQQTRKRLHELARDFAVRRREHLGALESRLRLLGPEQVLARGYSITRDARTGAVLRKAEKTKPGQQILTRLKVGEVASRVEK